MPVMFDPGLCPGAAAGREDLGRGDPGREPGPPARDAAPGEGELASGGTVS